MLKLMRTPDILDKLLRSSPSWNSRRRHAETTGLIFPYPIEAPYVNVGPNGIHHTGPPARQLKPPVWGRFFLVGKSLLYF